MSYCGIDFGTSNSAVGFLNKGKSQLIKLENNYDTIPSAIFYNFEDSEVYFGRSAIKEYIENSEGRLLRALKSILGTALIEEETLIKGQKLAFTEIIGQFFTHLKRITENEIQQDINSVVIGRPVRFVDNDDRADNEAQRQLESIARQQGFKNISFQLEPIAAALNYEIQARSEELALIVDIGGGTADFSVIKISPNHSDSENRNEDILANAGIHIGGNDFDRLLNMKCVAPELGYKTYSKYGNRELPSSHYFDLSTWHRISFLYKHGVLREIRDMRNEASEPNKVDRFLEIVSEKKGHALAALVENAKIELTHHEKADIQLELESSILETTITRCLMNDSIKDSVDKLNHTIASVIKDAQVQANDFNTVFLTGGSTAIQLVRDCIQKLLPQAKLIEGDIFGSVGLGLAIDAGRKFE